jgi:trehalose 6-phosphate synthase
MHAALQQSGGLWFGWSGQTVSADVGDAWVREQEGITYATMDLNEADYRGYYEGYANQVLWPLFHNRVDLAVFDRGPFEKYRSVNEQFAARLERLLKPDDVIWVQDYHLIPLGEDLRRLGCRQRIGFFLHTPFPRRRFWSRYSTISGSFAHCWPMISSASRPPMIFVPSGTTSFRSCEMAALPRTVR